MESNEEETPIIPSTENEEIATSTNSILEVEEVEDPYFHLRDGNYIGGLTMP